MMKAYRNAEFAHAGAERAGSMLILHGTERFGADLLRNYSQNVSLANS